MFFTKSSFFFCLFISFLFSNNWVLQYKGAVFYEDTFYSYFPKNDWKKIKDKKKKRALFDGFVKQTASVYECRVLGLDLEPELTKKINLRFASLLVNEYYMGPFLRSLVSRKNLDFCLKNLKKDVFVNHILIDKKNKNLSDSVLSVLKGGGVFKDVALEHSIDPYVKENFGSLGWVGLGQTSVEFQSLVFGLCEGCFGVVETELGFHVVRVDSIKASSYAFLDKLEYDDFAFRFATNYIKRPLKDLAAQHDSLLLKESGVVFNLKNIKRFVDLVAENTKNKKMDRTSFLDLLRTEQGVFVKCGGSVFSGLWFANEMSNSFYKKVYFDSMDLLLKEFKLVVLRFLVKNKALKLNVDKLPSFQKQFRSVQNSLLEKAFLKNLLLSVEVPTKEDVELYYYKHEKDLFLNKKTGQPFGLGAAFGSVETILLQEKQELKKTSFFDSLKNERVVINEAWLFSFD